MARKRKAVEAGPGPADDRCERLDSQMAAVCAIARLAKAAEGMPRGSKAKTWALGRVERLLAQLEAAPL